MLKFLLAAIVFISSCSVVRASVIINETSPATNPEWVELYNPDNVAYSLSGWTLVDNANHVKSLTSLGTIQPGQYLVFSEPAGWLNNSGGDSLTLFSNATQSAQLDTMSYTTTSATTSYARIPNITGSFVSSENVSPGEANSNPSPSPTSTPTASPTPTPTPSPSVAPTATPTPKPSPSLKPSPSPSPEGEVAGASTAEINLSGFGVSPSPSPTTTPKSDKLALNQTRAKTAIIVGVGLILLSVAGYLGYRQYLRRKPPTDL